MESWFACYPPSQRERLRSRIRSEDDGQHDAAFFELLLHELLVRLGCRVEVDPERGSRPDFIVDDQKGLRWYLEAVTISADPAFATKAQGVMNNLCEWLNERLPRRDFLLLVSYIGRPSGSLSRKDLLDFLVAKLSGADYEEVLKDTRNKGTYAGPCWKYKWGDCGIRFQLIPRAEPARRDDSVPALGYPNYEVEMNMDQMIDRMRKAIVKKARKYGGLRKPFLVAINVRRWPLNPIEFMMALFGWDDVAYGFTKGPEMSRLGMPRPSGVWLEGFSSGGIRYRRLSGVLCCSLLDPWSLEQASVCLYNNPWANYQYESVLNRLPRCVTRADGTSEEVAGLLLADILAG